MQTYYYGSPNGSVDGPADFATIKHGVQSGRIDDTDLYVGVTSAGPWVPYLDVEEKEIWSRPPQFPQVKEYGKQSTKPSDKTVGKLPDPPAERASKESVMSVAPLLNVIGFVVAGLAFSGIVLAGLDIFERGFGLQTIMQLSGLLSALVIGLLLVGAAEVICLLVKIARSVEK